MNMHKQHQIDSLERAIERSINRDPKDFCIGRPTRKWFDSQERQLSAQRKRLHIVKSHAERVYFTNDLRAEFVLLEAR